MRVEKCPLLYQTFIYLLFVASINDFLTSTFFLYLLLDIILWEPPPPSHLYVHLYRGKLIYIYFIRWSIACYDKYLLWCSSFHRLDPRQLCHLVPAEPWHVLRLFRDLFTFWCNNLFQTPLVLSPAPLWNRPSFQGVLVPLSKEYYLETKTLMRGYPCVGFFIKFIEKTRSLL